MAGLSKRKYDIQFYVKVVEKFVQTGECAKTLYGETESACYSILCRRRCTFILIKKGMGDEKMLTPL